MTPIPSNIGSLSATPYVDAFTTGEILGFVMIVVLFVGIFIVVARNDLRAAIWAFGVTAVMLAWITLAAWLFTGEIII